MLDEVRKLIAESAESLQAIANGADVGHTWLRNLVHDGRGDYGVRKVARVRDYLLKKAADSSGAIVLDVAAKPADQQAA